LFSQKLLPIAIGQNRVKRLPIAAGESEEVWLAVPVLSPQTELGFKKERENEC